MLHNADNLRQALLRRCGGAKVVLPVTLLLHALVVALVAQVIVHQSVASIPSALLTGWFWCTVVLLGLVAGIFTFFTRTIVVGAIVTCVPPTIMVFCSYFKALITSVPLTIQDFLLIGQLGDITELNASSIHFSPLSLGCILFLVLWLVLVSLLLYPVRLPRKPSLWAGAGCTAAVVLVFRPVSFRRSRSQPSVTKRRSAMVFVCMVLSAFSMEFAVFWHPNPPRRIPASIVHKYTFFILQLLF